MNIPQTDIDHYHDTEGSKPVSTTHYSEQTITKDIHYQDGGLQNVPN